MELRLHLASLRRFLVLGVLAALTAVPTASAAFQPIRRDFGELTYPRVRAGKTTSPEHYAGAISQCGIAVDSGGFIGMIEVR